MIFHPKNLIKTEGSLLFSGEVHATAHPSCARSCPAAESMKKPAGAKCRSGRVYGIDLLFAKLIFSLKS